MSVQNWFVFGPRWRNFGLLVATNGLKMVASDHYLKQKYSCNPIQTWCAHLCGERSELNLLLATLTKFWRSSGHKMTETGGFRPLSEKVLTKSNSNLVWKLIFWIEMSHTIVIKEERGQFIQHSHCHWQWVIGEGSHQPLNITALECTRLIDERFTIGDDNGIGTISSP